MALELKTCIYKIENRIDSRWLTVWLSLTPQFWKIRRIVGASPLQHWILSRKKQNYPAIPCRTSIEKRLSMSIRHFSRDGFHSVLPAASRVTTTVCGNLRLDCQKFGQSATSRSDFSSFPSCQNSCDLGVSRIRIFPVLNLQHHIRFSSWIHRSCPLGRLKAIVRTANYGDCPVVGGIEFPVRSENQQHRLIRKT